MELELMLIDGHDGQLVSMATPLLKRLAGKTAANFVKAEVTESMIELNSAVHASSTALEDDLRALARAVRREGRRLNVDLSGGGAHPFRDWHLRKITRSGRFSRIYETYGYLAKQFTVFGQHVHVAVPDMDEAVYLTHAFGSLVPHFIALSAASPFQRGVDTTFQSARSNVVSAFPLSGHMPPVDSWKGFMNYFQRMRATGLVESMKDFYWDVRPKPEFSTIELRVMDTPLSIEHAVDLAVFTRGCAAWLTLNRPAIDIRRLYEVYSVNRFRAARFGYEAELFDAIEDRPVTLREDIIRWCQRCLELEPPLADRTRLRRLARRARRGVSDAGWMRAQRSAGGASFARVMASQSRRLLKRSA
ncbi:MAG: YbdK family carboxylate-amine ligase [Steroidobacteraceae bacterium]